MEQRLSLITLAVANVAESRRFYERLGWRASFAAAGDEVAFFQCGGMALSLYGREALAQDAGLPPPASSSPADAPASLPAAASGTRPEPAPARPNISIALAHNVRSREAVNATLAEAERAGARILRPAADVFWGGYTGYFADPDGHVWEVAWNPHFPLDETGALTLPA